MPTAFERWRHGPSPHPVNPEPPSQSTIKPSVRLHPSDHPPTKNNNLYTLQPNTKHQSQWPTSVRPRKCSSEPSGEIDSLTWYDFRSIRLGTTAPDFEADTTQGRIKFHEWIGDSWCVFFSHPEGQLVAASFPPAT